MKLRSKVCSKESKQSQDHSAVDKTQLGLSRDTSHGITSMSERFISARRCLHGVYRRGLLGMSREMRTSIEVEYRTSRACSMASGRT
jgi:hypothetical protein